ncbi:PKD domain-containing protein [Pontibacter sp. G13]|uniref:PKD domain-containing protein n=1 Tax=Pontibacter sp. G13 TaxID=3074898 RepID=UPI00288ACDAE|nr:PKD domain-containing protein [Pontibacter sp. G13]WNJ16401.1 PKD domain-containing protein [Pontibacter sp. G13]
MFWMLMASSSLAQTSLFSTDWISACDSADLTIVGTWNSYLWSDGSSNPNLVVFQSGDYWCEVNDGVTIVRDTISVEVLGGLPVANIDTMFCSGDTVTLPTLPSGSFYLQMGDTVSSIAGFSNALKVTAAGDTSLAMQIFQKSLISGLEDTVGLTVPGTSGNGGYLTITNARGIQFDVLIQSFFQRVAVWADGPISTSVFLVNGQGDTLLHNPVQLVAGKNWVEINTLLEVQNNYVLRLDTPIGSGKLYVDKSSVYPISTDQIYFERGQPSKFQWSYFYEWVVIPIVGCFSDTFQVNVDVLPVPSVSLPLDTIACVDSFEVLVSASAGTLAWSTGESTPSIWVQSTGSYTATADLNGCTASDTFSITIMDPLPSILSLAKDTSVCQGTTLLWDSLPGEVYYSFFETATEETPFWVNQAFELTPDDTLTNYFELFRPISISGMPSYIGILTPFASGGGGFVSIAEDRGIEFTTTESFHLLEVTTHVDGPLEGEVVILNSLGDTLFKQHEQFEAGGNEISIQTLLPAGETYSLMLMNPVGTGKIFIDTKQGYPFSNGPVTFLTGNPIAKHWSLFYNWQVVPVKGCRSDRVANDLKIGETPIIDLGSDTLICSNQAVLDVTFPNPLTTYVWNNGATTGSIVLQNTDTVSVEASILSCSARDTVIVEVMSKPAILNVQDTVLCYNKFASELIIPASSGSEWVFWYDSSSNIPAYIGNSRDYLIEGESESFVLARGTFSQLSNISGNPSIPAPLGLGAYTTVPNDRGMVFSSEEEFLFHALSFHVTQSGEAHFVIEDSNGLELFADTFSLEVGENRVLLNTILPAGENHRMYLRKGSGGVMYADASINYPLSQDGITIVEAFPQASNYYFFYNWEIYPARYCLSDTMTYQASISIPRGLMSDSIYACDPIELIATSNLQAAVLWGNGDTTLNLSVASTEEITLQISDGAGCTVEDTIFVEIPENAGLAEDGILCGDVLFTNYDEQAIHLWSTGDSSNTLDISALGAGTYWVEVLEPRGCFLTDTIVVSGFDQFPTLNLGDDLQSCDSILLGSSQPNMTYEWSTGASSPFITAYSSGLYILTITNPNNCATTDTVGVLISKVPQAEFFVPDTIINTDLTVYFINQSDFGDFLWEFGDGQTSTQISPVHTYSDTGWYCVNLITTDLQSNCGSDTATHCVYVQRPNSTDISSLEDISVNVYPNPNYGQIWVDLPDSFNASWNIQMIDGVGRSILSTEWEAGASQKILFEMPDVSRGIYHLRITCGTHQWSFPILYK